MKKKALSQVEVVLSFVIFLTFVFFLFFVVKPIPKPKNISFLDSASYNFIENISIKVSTVSLKLKNPISGCFNININDFNCDYNKEVILTKNSTGQIINSELSSSRGLLINYSGYFYTIYCSKEFKPRTVSDICSNLGLNNYSIGVIRDYKLISYNRTSEFVNLYNNSYENAKDILRLPKNIDFAFTIRNSTRGIIFSAEKRSPSRLNFFTKEIPIDIINENAETIPAFLEIKMW